MPEKTRRSGGRGETHGSPLKKMQNEAKKCFVINKTLQKRTQNEPKRTHFFRD